MTELRTVKVYSSETSDVRTETFELQNISYVIDASSGVATVQLDLPKKLNPLLHGTIWEMHLVLEHLALEPSVRVVVWTGKGRAFCAGADFNLPPSTTVPEHVQKAYIARGIGRELTDFACKRLVLHFWDFPKPIITAVNGLAVGGGANLALVCPDMAIAGESARFLFPFTKLGIVPEFGSSLLFPIIMGMARAKQALLTNEWISATQAEQMGLVNSVVPDADLLATAHSAACKLAAFSPRALRESKALMHGPWRQQLSQQLDRENKVFLEMVNSEEFKSNLRAAAAKKKAKSGSQQQSRL